VHNGHSVEGAEGGGQIHQALKCLLARSDALDYGGFAVGAGGEDRFDVKEGADRAGRGGALPCLTA
jgi:hypothetical protein